MQIENITLTPILDSISLNLPDTGLIAIIGPNGAGKSSFLKVLAGLLTPKMGRVYYQGSEIISQNSIERSLLISYLPQSPVVYWDISVKDIIMLGLIRHQLTADEKESRLIAMIQKLHLQHLIDQSVYTLSGGELARVHMARMLIAKTPILLADEPTAALDLYFQLEIMKILKKESHNKLAIVILHDLETAIRYCDYFVLLQNGQLVIAGKKEQVITSDYLRQSFFVETSIDLAKNKIIVSEQTD